MPDRIGPVASPEKRGVPFREGAPLFFASKCRSYSSVATVQELHFGSHSSGVRLQMLLHPGGALALQLAQNGFVLSRQALESFVQRIFP